jgi:hypothetical protein
LSSLLIDDVTGQAGVIVVPGNVSLSAASAAPAGLPPRRARTELPTPRNDEIPEWPWPMTADQPGCYCPDARAC